MNVKKIAVVGSMNMDYVIEVQAMPLVGETILCQGFSMIPGGKGANQAYAAGKLGGQVTMLGAVGCDQAGEALCESLRSVGVDVSRIKHCQGENTGTAFISVDKEGHNSITVAQGANRAVDIPYIQQNMDVLEECDIVLFQLEIPLETVVFAAQKAKALGKTVILDPAPARTDIPRELYACVDYLKPNEVELTTLTADGSAEDHLEQAAAGLQAQGVKNVVVTLGGKGAFLLEEQGKASFHPADTTLHVVDSTAAGDSFTAALAGGLANGLAIDEAVNLAIRVSNIVVTRKGAQTSIPTMEEVMQFTFQAAVGQ